MTEENALRSLLVETVGLAAELRISCLRTVIMS